MISCLHMISLVESSLEDNLPVHCSGRLFAFSSSDYLEALQCWNSHHHWPKAQAVVVHKCSHLLYLLGRVQDAYNTQRYLLSSVQFSRSVVSDSLRPHESQHAWPPCPSPTPGVHSNSCPSSRWCHPAISSSVIPSPPAPNLSQHQSLFQWVNSSHEVAKVLEFQL